MNDKDILKTLRKLENEILRRKRRRSVSISSILSDGDRASPRPVDSPPPSPPQSPPRKKRRRIIYSDSEEEQDETDNVPSNASDTNNDDILAILGDDPTITKDFGDNIHAHMAVRWNNLLQKGLKKDNRAELLKKYLPPANCKYILPPTLNDEIKAAVQETAVKRDSKLELKQAQLGAGLTCIGKALDAALEIPDRSLRDRIVKLLGDSGQILTDLHFLESTTRRSLLMQGLNKNTKEAIKELQRDKLLFGEGLPEKLKAVKACTKSAMDLKSKQSKPSTSRQKGDTRSATATSSYNTTEALNWRGSSRRSTGGAATAGAYRDRRPATSAPPTPAAPRRAQTSQQRPPAKRH